MKTVRKLLLLFILFISFTGCSSSSNSSPASVPRGEYLYRKHNEELFTVEPLLAQQRELYPWEIDKGGAFPKITKEFFRCKGCSLNPVRMVQNRNDIQRYFDCGGSQRHSLPLRNQKEFIYPILIDLLNYVQTQTGKRVVITCGHCCPDHSLYLDSTPANQCSKHLIGAEVDFYVQDMEFEPEKVIDLIQRYYQEQPKYQGMADYREFKRYDGAKTNVSITPWYNKEIFIKLVKKWEGRDFDNRHPYPYITVQVRYDWDLQERVNYSWDSAFRNFHRW